MLCCQPDSSCQGRSFFPQDGVSWGAAVPGLQGGRLGEGAKLGSVHPKHQQRVLSSQTQTVFPHHSPHGTKGLRAGWRGSQGKTEGKLQGMGSAGREEDREARPCTKKALTPMRPPLQQRCAPPSNTSAEAPSPRGAPTPQDSLYQGTGTRGICLSEWRAGRSLPPTPETLPWPTLPPAVGGNH